MKLNLSGYAVFLALIALNSSPGFAQKKQSSSDSLSLEALDRTDLIDFAGRLFVKDHSKIDRTSEPGDVHFSVVPIAPSSSGHGKVTVSAINASFRLGKETNISSIYFYPSTNFTTSYGLQISPYIWFDKNAWNGTGDFRIVHNALQDYGLGTSSVKTNVTEINHNQVRVYFAAVTRILPNLYVGAGYNLDHYSSVGEIDPTPESPSDFSNYPFGTGSETVASGITANVLRDNRKNPINPTQGYYIAAVLRANRPAMGSTSEWSSFFLDGRKYYSFSNRRHKIFAVRGFYWGTFGDVPYLCLPTTFDEPISSRAGRGYVTYRYRGKHMLYAEAEYRFDITSHGFLGGVLFANAQSLTEPVSETFGYIRPAAGFGFRFKFNRNSDTNITLDFAWGKDGFNWFVNLGEYF